MKRKLIIIVGLALFLWCFLPVFAGIFNIGSVTGSGLSAGSLWLETTAVHVTAMAGADDDSLADPCHWFIDYFYYGNDGCRYLSANRPVQYRYCPGL